MLYDELGGQPDKNTGSYRRDVAYPKRGGVPRTIIICC